MNVAFGNTKHIEVQNMKSRFHRDSSYAAMQSAGLDSHRNKRLDFPKYKNGLMGPTEKKNIIYNMMLYGQT